MNELIQNPQFQRQLEVVSNTQSLMPAPHPTLPVEKKGTCVQENPKQPSFFSNLITTIRNVFTTLYNLPGSVISYFNTQAESAQNVAQRHLGLLSDAVYNNFEHFVVKGMTRVSGESKNIDAIIESIQKNDNFAFDDKLDVYDIYGAMRRCFVNAQSNSDREYMLDVIKKFAKEPDQSKDEYIQQMASLPKPVETILPFFAKLSLPDHSKITNLDTSSLGKILAPNINNSKATDFTTASKDLDVAIDFATRLIAQRAARLNTP
ncbi:hypothetical protein [Enterobacter ludwigii]